MSARLLRSHTESETRTSFGPVVTGTTLTEDEIVRSEERTEGSRTKRVHGTGLEIDQDGAGNILVRPDFVIIDVNSFELEVVRSLVDTVTPDTVLIGHGLPELGTYSKWGRDDEYRRRRGIGIAIAHRFGYRTGEVKKISTRHMCAGSGGTG